MGAVLEGRYELEVIDIYQQPVLTRGEQIVAAPTLVKKLPLPMRRIVGDMSTGYITLPRCRLRNCTITAQASNLAIPAGD